MAFDQTKADTICKRLAEGESLRAICRGEGMPSQATVLNWADEQVSIHPPFIEQYARARLLGYRALAEEIIEIADETGRDTYTDEDGNERTNHEVVARSRLRVDTRKWMLSKMLPKIYGDKIETTHTGPNGGPVQFQNISRTIVDPSE